MGLITLGLFAGNNLGSNGAVLQMVNHGLISAALFLMAGMVERRASTGELALLGGFARGRPALATALMTTGVIALAVPLSSAFAGEFLILAGVFQQGWAWAVIGAGSIVLGAMYVLRLISAVLHGKIGSAVSEAAMDLRDAELGMVVPLIACLLVLSASPNLISGHSFGGNLAFAASNPASDWVPGVGIPCDAAQQKYELAHPNPGKPGTTVIPCTGTAKLRVTVTSNSGGAGSTVSFSWRPS
jgi:formate hydrogenlyase subunit 3/multisubunit Na+/H+ antiporter MnhD subunit